MKLTKEEVTTIKNILFFVVRSKMPEMEAEKMLILSRNLDWLWKQVEENEKALKEKPKNKKKASK